MFHFHSCERVSLVGKMGKGFEYVKDTVVNFKLDWCCWLLPLRIGLIIAAYFNMIMAMISLVGIADESFAPIIVQIQNTLFDDGGTKPVPMIAYTAEMVFNAILLCAIYRKDVTLMRLYMKYSIAVIIASIMFYSMVLVAVGVIVVITMVFSVLFQIYILILVRSLIVEMRLERKNQELPTLVMSTLIEKKEGAEEIHEKPDVDVEAPEEQNEKQIADENKPETKLETVDEHPKEEAVSEIK